MLRSTQPDQRATTLEVYSDRPAVGNMRSSTSADAWSRGCSRTGRSRLKHVIVWTVPRCRTSGGCGPCTSSLRVGDKRFNPAREPDSSDIRFLDRTRYGPWAPWVSTRGAIFLFSEAQRLSPVLLRSIFQSESGRTMMARMFPGVPLILWERDLTALTPVFAKAKRHRTRGARFYRRHVRLLDSLRLLPERQLPLTWAVMTTNTRPGERRRVQGKRPALRVGLGFGRLEGPSRGFVGTTSGRPRGRGSPGHSAERRRG